MKKFLFTTYVIFLMALVPAIVFGYLHNNTGNQKANTETSKEASNNQSEERSLQLVKTF
jgi:hypothetical protein